MLKVVQRVLVAIAVCSLLLAIVFPGDPGHNIRGLTTVDEPVQKERDLKTEHLIKLEQEHFNTLNPHKEWCPNAKCSNSPMCSPCNRRFLFIVASGRSGSTTLLDMLDHLPGVRLSGENWGELNIAADLDKNLNKGFFSNHEVVANGPFQHNPVNEQSLACVHQHLVHALNPPEGWMQHFADEPFDQYDASTILGLKTIRVQDKDWTPKEAAAYFQENFPCSRFVVNIREDINAQAVSMVRFFHETNWTEVLEIIEYTNNFLREFVQELGPQTAKLLVLKEWMGDVSHLNHVLDWMGFDECKFKDVIHENHKDFELNVTKPDLGEKCTYPFL